MHTGKLREMHLFMSPTRVVQGIGLATNSRCNVSPRCTVAQGRDSRAGGACLQGTASGWSQRSEGSVCWL